jgi:hypothetical protein
MLVPGIILKAEHNTGVCSLDVVIDAYVKPPAGGLFIFIGVDVCRPGSIF